MRLISILVVAGLGSPALGTTIIDFEDWTGGEEPQYIVTSSGFDFHGFLSVGPASASNNSTNALDSLQSTLKMNQVGLASFSVISIDLHEGLDDTGTASVKLVGSRDSTQVVQTFALDGDPDTYETFHPVGFSDLVGVHFYAYDAQGDCASGLSIDNVVVPEPTMIGALPVAVWLLRKRRY